MSFSKTRNFNINKLENGYALLNNELFKRGNVTMAMILLTTYLKAFCNFSHFTANNCIQGRLTSIGHIRLSLKTSSFLFLCW